MQLTLPGVKGLSKDISKISSFSDAYKMIPLCISGKGDSQFMKFTAVSPYLPAVYGNDGITCASEPNYFLVTSTAGGGINAGSFRSQFMDFRYIDYIYIRVYADGDMERIVDYGAAVAENQNGSGEQYGLAKKVGAGWIQIDVTEITTTTRGYIHAYLITNEVDGTSEIKVYGGYAEVTDDTPDPNI